MIRQMTAPRYMVIPLLSPAEERVLRAVLAGHTTRYALELELQLAPGTVRAHLSAIRGKTHSINLVEVVLWAVRNGYEIPGANKGEEK